MLALLWVVPFLPFAGFLVLATGGSYLSKRAAAAIGAGSVGLSALLMTGIGLSFISSPPSGNVFSQTLWTWMNIEGLKTGITLYLDPLSLVMIFVITFVGFLIHIYSVTFMKEEEGYSRFFAYMNLFIGSMLVLVLADDLVLLYLGWEGVGLCSYLLIGFWYRDPANGYAARKAFVVTRIGDVALAVGLFLLYTQFGTFHIQDLMTAASGHWQSGSVLATAAALLILGGAVGKSAQLPLQTWLPDAMAGPTPVSALIHAATMVTAGVYLIARTHVLFSLAPAAQTAVAVIGAVTLLLAGCSAIAQRDIKRVLAYSTISQIGYMFLALGVGAWAAAMFHFMVHAFFKALLFLGAGVVSMALHHERDLFKMGGLREQMPLAFWTFLVGASSLSALPFVTAGFYSKELILWKAWNMSSGGAWLWTAGITGAFITSIYSFRMVFLAFFGDAKTEVSLKPSIAISAPLAVLAFLSLTAGFIETPAALGGISIFSGFMGRVFPASPAADSPSAELTLQITASLVSVAGVYCAYIFFLRNRGIADIVLQSKTGTRISRLWFSGWGFNRVYDTIFVRPFLWMVRVNRDDFIDLVYSGAAWFTELFHRGLSITQSGRLRWYALAIAFGSALFIAMGVFL
jgi:NADH-quinone oxidoreductase subunit L